MALRIRILIWNLTTFISISISKSKKCQYVLKKNSVFKKFCTNLRIILPKLKYSNFVYSVLTLYKSLCSFIIPFQSFAFMDVVILVVWILLLRFLNTTTLVLNCRYERYKRNQPPTKEEQSLQLPGNWSNNLSSNTF